MPVYEYECHGPQCKTEEKPREFEGHQTLAKHNEPIECPNCNTSAHVKKVIRSAFPKSNSWRV